MPLTQPLAGDVHVNRPLTNFGQRYMQSADAFVALRAMPNLPVSKQSDLYWEWDKGDWFRARGDELIRADGTESAGAGYRVSTNSYAAVVRAFHKDVTDRQRANADEAHNLDEAAAQFVALQLLINREVKFAATYMTTGVWGTDLNVDWTSASVDPVPQVRTGKRTVQTNTGYRPNRMLFGRQAWDTLLENDLIMARISGGATVDKAAIATRRLIAELFELESIEVMDAVQNTAQLGAADAFSLIGGDLALLYYAPAQVSQGEPTAGVQFSWTGYTGATQQGFRTSRFRMENVKADRVEGEMAYDYKVVAPALGYMFTSPSAP